MSQESRIIPMPAFTEMVNTIQSNPDAEFWATFIGDGRAPVFIQEEELEGARKVFDQTLDPVQATRAELEGAVKFSQSEAGRRMIYLRESREIDAIIEEKESLAAEERRLRETHERLAEEARYNIWLEESPVAAAIRGSYWHDSVNHNTRIKNALLDVAYRNGLESVFDLSRISDDEFMMNRVGLKGLSIIRKAFPYTSL